MNMSDLKEKSRKNVKYVKDEADKDQKVKGNILIEKEEKIFEEKKFEKTIPSDLPFPTSEEIISFIDTITENKLTNLNHQSICFALNYVIFKTNTDVENNLASQVDKIIENIASKKENIFANVELKRKIQDNFFEFYNIENKNLIGPFCEKFSYNLYGEFYQIIDESTLFIFDLKSPNCFYSRKEEFKFFKHDNLVTWTNEVALKTTLGDFATEREVEVIPSKIIEMFTKPKRYMQVNNVEIEEEDYFKALAALSKKEKIRIVDRREETVFDQATSSATYALLRDNFLRKIILTSDAVSKKNIAINETKLEKIEQCRGKEFRSYIEELKNFSELENSESANYFMKVDFEFLEKASSLFKKYVENSRKTSKHFYRIVGGEDQPSKYVNFKSIRALNSINEMINKYSINKAAGISRVVYNSLGKRKIGILYNTDENPFSDDAKFYYSLINLERKSITAPILVSKKFIENQVESINFVRLLNLTSISDTEFNYKTICNYCFYTNQTKATILSSDWMVKASCSNYRFSRLFDRIKEIIKDEVIEIEFIRCYFMSIFSLGSTTCFRDKILNPSHVQDSKYKSLLQCHEVSLTESDLNVELKKSRPELASEHDLIHYEDYPPGFWADYIVGTFKNLKDANNLMSIMKKTICISDASTRKVMKSTSSVGEDRREMSWASMLSSIIKNKTTTESLFALVHNIMKNSHFFTCELELKAQVQGARNLFIVDPEMKGIISLLSHIFQDVNKPFNAELCSKPIEKSDIIEDWIKKCNRICDENKTEPKEVVQFCIDFSKWNQNCRIPQICSIIDILTSMGFTYNTKRDPIHPKIISQFIKILFAVIREKVLKIPNEKYTKYYKSLINYETSSYTCSDLMNIDLLCKNPKSTAILMSNMENNFGNYHTSYIGFGQGLANESSSMFGVLATASVFSHLEKNYGFKSSEFKIFQTSDDLTLIGVLPKNRIEAKMRTGQRVIEQIFKSRFGMICSTKKMSYTLSVKGFNNFIFNSTFYSSKNGKQIVDYVRKLKVLTDNRFTSGPLQNYVAINSRYRDFLLSTQTSFNKIPYENLLYILRENYPYYYYLNIDSLTQFGIPTTLSYINPTEDFIRRAFLIIGNSVTGYFKETERGLKPFEILSKEKKFETNLNRTVKVMSGILNSNNLGTQVLTDFLSTKMSTEPKSLLTFRSFTKVLCMPFMILARERFLPCAFPVRTIQCQENDFIGEVLKTLLNPGPIVKTCLMDKSGSYDFVVSPYKRRYELDVLEKVIQKRIFDERFIPQVIDKVRFDYTRTKLTPISTMDIKYLQELINKFTLLDLFFSDEDLMPWPVIGRYKFNCYCFTNGDQKVIITLRDNKITGGLKRKNDLITKLKFEEYENILGLNVDFSESMPSYSISSMTNELDSIVLIGVDEVLKWRVPRFKDPRGFEILVSDKLQKCQTIVEIIEGF